MAATNVAPTENPPTTGVQAGVTGSDSSAERRKIAAEFLAKNERAPVKQRQRTEADLIPALKAKLEAKYFDLPTAYLLAQVDAIDNVIGVDIDVELAQMDEAGQQGYFLWPQGVEPNRAHPHGGHPLPRRTPPKRRNL